MSRARDYELFAVEGLPLQSGEDCPTLSIAYKTYGTLNARRDNAILYPTSFSAQHHDTEWLVRPGGTLDPERYFVVIPNLFGNGLSSSPSNFGAAPFPSLTYHDAVAAQHRMLTELWGIEELALVYGWSMGGMQAYHWAALHPDMVRRVAVVCGSARCSPYNAVFLEGVRAALTADPAFVDGRFRHAPGAGFPRHGPGLRRVGAVTRLLSRRAVARLWLQRRWRTTCPGTGMGCSQSWTRTTCLRSSASGSAAI